MMQFDTPLYLILSLTNVIAGAERGRAGMDEGWKGLLGDKRCIGCVEFDEKDFIPTRFKKS